MKPKEPMKTPVRGEEPDTETGNHKNEDYEPLTSVEQSIIQGFQDVANGDVLTWDAFVVTLEEDDTAIPD